MRVKYDATINKTEVLDDHWPMFDERERRLICNCIAYEQSDPAGLPGHNLMIIVAKMAELLGVE